MPWQMTPLEMKTQPKQDIIIISAVAAAPEPTTTPAGKQYMNPAQ